MNRQIKSSAPGVSGSRRFLKIIFTLILLLILFVTGVWVWSGSNGSLATALSLIGKNLPVKSVQMTEVNASLRNGGTIGTITIEQADGSTIVLNGITLDWNTLDLLKKNLVIQKLSVQTMHLINAAPLPNQEKNNPVTSFTYTNTTTSSKAPEKIYFPVHIDLQKLLIDHIYRGEGEELASNIDLNYQYNGSQHHLQLHNAHLADGVYQGQLNLSAEQPELDARFSGVLTTLIPQSKQQVTIHASVQAQGPLTLLDVHADAKIISNASSDTKSTLSASVAPWAQVKIPALNLELNAFNPRAFWPQMPEALLYGTVNATSDVGSTDHQEIAKITLDLKNTASGPLDIEKLPVSSLTGSLSVQQERIQIDKASAKVGSDSIDITGELVRSHPPAPISWEAYLTLHRVDPHLIYSQLASDRISGTITLHQERAATITFETNITAEKGSNVPQFKLKQLVSHSAFYPNDRVAFNAVTAHSNDAQLQGNNVSYSLKTGAVSGPLRLTASGLSADADLNALAAMAGSAKISLEIHSSTRAARWLNAQPVHLKPVVDFLNQVSRYEDNLTNYVKKIPVTINGGWKNPTVGLDINLGKTLTQIIENKAKERLLGPLGKPQGSDDSTSRRQQREQDAINLLGNILNHSK